jgi:hypothetical protein
MNDSILLSTAALQPQRQAIHDLPVEWQRPASVPVAGDGSRLATTIREEES